MLDHAYSHYQTGKSAALQASLEAATTDWLILCMQTGMRKSDWCQNRHTLKKTRPVIQNKDGSISTFILGDFTFEKFNEKHCDNSTNIFIDDATVVKQKWRS